MGAVKFQRADLVVEARVAVGEAPADRRRRDARGARERATHTRAGTREAEVDAAALLGAERVAEGRAGRLPDVRRDTAALRERDLGEVGVVHVAREDDDRARRGPAPPRADVAQQRAHALERTLERRPVLEVGALADLLPHPRGGAAPRAVA